ncbi:SMI1/KNR4 family protein [Actinoplanes sp. NPDC024001]|uniref:SMI1/KNR4 family protein n=1 Tax=Actinoplanes sp. NPDC024001 TaxID=3154598 RepID=UPI0033FAAB5A
MTEALTLAELAEIERAVGVRLPEDYRTFLTEVGNGGPVGGFELTRVVRDGDGWRWTGNDPALIARLGTPFQPFDPAVREEHERARPVAGDFADAAAFEAACRAWIQREDDLYDEEAYGTLVLAHQGCGHVWRLAVSGPHRGTVWDDARGSDVPLTPITGPDGEPLTFSEWHRRLGGGAPAAPPAPSPPRPPRSPATAT